jgi:hypothetical protein
VIPPFKVVELSDALGFQIVPTQKRHLCAHQKHRWGPCSMVPINLAAATDHSKCTTEDPIGLILSYRKTICV